MTTILVIEDDPNSLLLTRAVLQQAGHTVLSADHAAGGLELARERHPDLILMDIQLPGMDGYAATRLLKADPATAGIPVCALTAHAMKGDEQKARLAGCDGYLAKPLGFADLLAAVTRSLQGKA